MADFEVRTDSLRDVAEQLNRTNHQVREISDEAKRIFLNTRGSITARLSMHLQRAVVCATINNCATDFKNISNTLFKVAAYYDMCEKKVMNAELFDEVNRPWWKDLIAIIPDIPLIGPVFPKPIIKPGIWDFIKPWGPGIINPWGPTRPRPIPPRPWNKPGFWMFDPWRPTPPPGPWTPWRPTPPVGPHIIYPGPGPWRPYPQPHPWVPRPWRPTPPRIVIPPYRPVPYIRIRPRIQFFGPGGQNPVYRLNIAGKIATSLIGNVTYTVGAAVRIV